MFGRIKICKPDMKIRDFEEYKEYYCSICFSLKKRGGNLSRLLLNYDIVFLSLIVDSLKEENMERKNFRCHLNPFLKRCRKNEHGKIMLYSADILIILSYFKLIDDYLDQKNVFKLLLSKLLKIRAKKVFNEQKETVQRIKELLDKGNKMEKDNADVRLLADNFGEVMETIAPSDKKPIGMIMYEMGRLLYYIDAIEDFDEDKKKGNFNPFNSKDDIKSCQQEVWEVLYKVAEIFELLPIKKNKDILINIIYFSFNNKLKSLFE